jgi:hypothetical protein
MKTCSNEEREREREREREKERERERILWRLSAMMDACFQRYHISLNK